MIIGGDRDQVVENIKEAVERKDYNCKVEMGDPVLTPEEEKKLLTRYIKNKNKIHYKLANRIAMFIWSNSGIVLNRGAKYDGLENVRDIQGGAIVTCNHSNPVENIALLKAFKKAGCKKKLTVVNQSSNLKMGGLFGYLMNNVNMIPIATNRGYTKKYFMPKIEEFLKNDELVLIYPEQEMWFNYRKPRPPKRGAYYFAAKYNVPILPCFISSEDLKKNETDEFHKIKYTVHIMKPIYPDAEKTEKENSMEMMRKDYELKKEAYEKNYGKQLIYEFDDSDIAGWIPKSER